MAKDRSFRVAVRNAERIAGGIQAATKPAMDRLASDLYQRLYMEVPEGETGNLAQSIKVVPKIQTKFTYNVAVEIGSDEVPYALAVWKGLDPEIYSVEPDTAPAMVIDIARWPQYDGRFGDYKIFKFYGKLRNFIPPNDFVGRAIEGIDRHAQEIFRKNIKVVFKGG